MYQDKLKEYQCKWSKAFVDYYMDNIHPQVRYRIRSVIIALFFLSQIPVSLGRWVLEELDIYQPYTGVTTNQSESFNALLKRLQRWREVPIDTILLSLYHLQGFFYNEFQRGLAGMTVF